MFFFKKEESGPKRIVAVLGTSPLAVFLTYVLQQNNVDVMVLDVLKKNKSEKAETWLFKSSFQNQNFSFKFCHEVEKRPEYCFLASSYDEYKSDLLRLSDDVLKDVPVINFAYFYNDKIIEQMGKINELRAHFNGWLIKTKKEISMLNRNVEIKFCNEGNVEKDVQLILNDKRVDIKFDKDSKKLFWQKRMSWFLGNLLILAYEDDVSKILLNSDIRNRVDGIIKEIFQISKDKERQLDTQLLLTDIYAFSDGFVSEYDSLRGVDALCKMIGDTNYFNHPKLFELIKEVTKKY